MPRYKWERVDDDVLKVIKRFLFDFPTRMNIAHKRDELSKKERRYHYVAKINPTVKASVFLIALPQEAVTTSFAASIDIVNMTLGILPDANKRFARLDKYVLLTDRTL